jgi:hypothetical protein
VSWLVAAIGWLTWQYRAHLRLRRLGTQGLKFTPGWGVGCWWLIQFANPWKPYQAIKELWVASDPAKGTGGWQGSKYSPRALVVGRVPGLRGLRLRSLQMEPETIDELISRDYGLFARDLAWIIAGILAMAIVRETDRRQCLISVGGAPKRPRHPRTSRQNRVASLPPSDVPCMPRSSGNFISSMRRRESRVRMFAPTRATRICASAHTQFHGTEDAAPARGDRIPLLLPAHS